MQEKISSALVDLRIVVPGCKGKCLLELPDSLYALRQIGAKHIKRMHVDMIDIRFCFYACLLQASDDSPPPALSPPTII